MIDYLIIAVLTYALNWYLNKQYFNVNPISRLKAILLSVVVFLVLTVFFAGLIHYRSTELGIPARNLFDFSSVAYSVFFYKFLNKKKKGEFEIFTATGGSVATFESKEKADEYISKNTDQSYVIKEK